MIERVQAFQTSDGSLFDNEVDAVAHDRKEALKEAVKSFWSRHGERVFDHDGDILTADDFLEHFQEFATIMKNLAQEE